MWYLENEVWVNFPNKIYATEENDENEDKILITKWKWPTILTDENNNIITSTIDLFWSWFNIKYKAYISETVNIEWSWIDIWWWLEMLALKWWILENQINVLFDL